MDSPLYPPPPWLYRGMRVLTILVGFAKDSIEPLLPEPLEPMGDPVLGAVWLAEYPFTNLGAYREALVAVQVMGKDGVSGYYVPYIYVDNDAAMAAGREVLGAPKKIARIVLGMDSSTMAARVERAGVVLVEAGMRVETRASEELLRGLLPEKTILYGLRVLPGVGGEHLAQLVQWYAKVWFSKGPGGLDAWTGTARLRLYGSPEDPVDQLKVKEVMGAFYIVADMELGVEKIVHEWRYKPS